MLASETLLREKNPATQNKSSANPVSIEPATSPIQV